MLLKDAADLCVAASTGRSVRVHNRQPVSIGRDWVSGVRAREARDRVEDLLAAGDSTRVAWKAA